MSWRQSPPALVLGSLAVVMLAGCVQLMAPRAPDSAATPAAQQSALFYPLDIGNHWGYENTLRFVVIPTGGTAGPPSEIQSALDVDVVGTEQRFGREYTVQRESDAQSQYQADFLYRQDKSGLFNADPEPATAARWTRHVPRLARTVEAATPSVHEAYRAALARVIEKQAAMRSAALRGSIGAAAGPLAGEIALLLYPLAPGKSWHVREDPLFVYTVEGQEGIDLPAGRFNGWRIRIDSEFFGPNDIVHVWYGRDGLLQLRAHVVGDVVDENGNVIGAIVSDQVEALSEVTLVKTPS